MKADINGYAVLIQGYAALLGLGITLIKNQIVDASPNAIKVILAGILLNRFFIIFSIIRLKNYFYIVQTKAGNLLSIGYGGDFPEVSLMS